VSEITNALAYRKSFAAYALGCNIPSKGNEMTSKRKFFDSYFIFKPKGDYS
jgi:hypothetical protein